MEFDVRNEVAGIAAVVGFLSLVGLLGGAATLVRAAIGAGGPFGLVAGATATALGLVGLLAVWAAVESGYFGSTEPVDDGPDEEPGTGTEPERGDERAEHGGGEPEPEAGTA